MTKEQIYKAVIEQITPPSFKQGSLRKNFPTPEF